MRFKKAFSYLQRLADYFHILARYEREYLMECKPILYIAQRVDEQGNSLIQDDNKYSVMRVNYNKSLCKIVAATTAINQVTSDNPKTKEIKFQCDDTPKDVITTTVNDIL